jgi:sugar transferase EpsL
MGSACLIRDVRQHGNRMAEGFNRRQQREQRRIRFSAFSATHPAQSKRQSVLKRCLDLIFVLGSALFWLPIIAVLALLVRRKLGSPVLFRQPRPGRNAAVFELLKFRTMTNARDSRGQLLPDAQRLTTFGRWLRATSLDELPELFNVIKGEMSLVGPRPLLIQYLPLYTAEQARRHEVLPGITGWAQINGRNTLSWEEKFQHDIWYVDHQSLGLDVKILAATMLKVIRRDGISAAGEATMPPFTGNQPDEPKGEATIQQTNRR